MSTLRRLLMLVVILPGFCAYLLLSNSDSTQAWQEPRAQDPSTEGSGDRLREGTVLELQGSFKLTGDRIMFYGANKRRFGTLENLNLERISRMVSDSVEPLEWHVSGTVTEFQGSNYLLISRAVLKSKPQRRSGGARPEAAAAPG